MTRVNSIHRFYTCDCGWHGLILDLLESEDKKPLTRSDYRRSLAALKKSAKRENAEFIGQSIDCCPRCKIKFSPATKRVIEIRDGEIVRDEVKSDNGKG